MAVQEPLRVSFRVAPGEFAVLQIKLLAGEADSPSVTDPALVVKQAAGVFDVGEMLDHRSGLFGGETAVACFKKRMEFLAGRAAVNAPVGRNEAFMGEIPGMRGMAAAAALFINAVRISCTGGQSENAVHRQQGEGAQGEGSPQM